MSNLDKAIEEEDITIGEIRIIMTMCKNGFTADAVDRNIEYVTYGKGVCG